MNHKIYWLITPLFFLLHTNVYAEYKSFNDMSKEEFQRVNESMADYDDCLNEYAYAMVEKQPDPRVVADHSMKECVHILEKLHSELTMNNYSPEYSSRFISKMANRSANDLLSKLIRVAAALQSRQESE